MDNTRLLIVFISNICLQLITISPNSDNESDDKFVVIKDANPGKFSRYVLYNVITGLLAFSHILDHYDSPLTVFEWILIVVAGFLFFLRMWSYYTLKKFFTFKIGIMKNHYLVQTGPYKYLVHPSYTAQVGFVFIMLLFFQAYYLSIIIVPFVLLKLRNRMKIEESMFLEKFPTEYAEYLANRNRLIPYIY